jgi:hypothetical protein
MTNTKSSRRAFFLQGSAALGAGVAATAGTAALASGQAAPVDTRLGELQLKLGGMEDREAIRQLHLAFIDSVENQAIGAATGAGAAILRLRPNHLQQKDTLVLGKDRLQATAMYHVDVALGTPLLGDSTVAQMARLQGHVANHRWETGRLEAKYVKTRGQWAIASLDYLAS